MCWRERNSLESALILTILLSDIFTEHNDWIMVVYKPKELLLWVKATGLAQMTGLASNRKAGQGHRDCRRPLTITGGVNAMP